MVIDWGLLIIAIPTLCIILVGGFNPSEKYKSVGMIIIDCPNIWENKKCSKPPISIHKCKLSLMNAGKTMYDYTKYQYMILRLY